MNKDLPDKYDAFFDNDLPTNFKLSEAVKTDKKGHNTLMKLADEDIEKHSPNKEEVAQENDLAYARKGLKDNIASAVDVLEEAINLAKAGDSPRAYEVVANMLKTISDMNSELVKLHHTSESTKKIRKERIGGEGPTQSVTNQQNNFYLSPKEAIAQLKERDIKDIN